MPSSLHFYISGEDMSLKRAASMVIGACMMIVMLASCASEDAPGETGTPTSQSPMPKIGTIAYDNHQCEIVYTGTGPVNGWEFFEIGGLTYCYVRVGVSVYDMYPLTQFMGNNWSPTGLQPTFRRDFSDGKGGEQFDTLVVMAYSDRLWRRAPIGTDAVEVYYNNTWVTLSDYNLLEQQRLASESAATQQAEEAARQRTALEVGKIQERIIEMGRVWVQPDCNFSSNGCF